MEGGVFIALIVLQLLGIDQSAAGQRFTFIVPYLQENLYLMTAMSGVFGAIRVVGALVVSSRAAKWQKRRQNPGFGRGWRTL